MLGAHQTFLWELHSMIHPLGDSREVLVPTPVGYFCTIYPQPQGVIVIIQGPTSKYALVMDYIQLHPCTLGI